MSQGTSNTYNYSRIVGNTIDEDYEANSTDQIFYISYAVSHQIDNNYYNGTRRHFGYTNNGVTSFRENLLDNDATVLNSIFCDSSSDPWTVFGNGARMFPVGHIVYATGDEAGQTKERTKTAAPGTDSGDWTNDTLHLFSDSNETVAYNANRFVIRAPYDTSPYEGRMVGMTLTLDDEENIHESDQRSAGIFAAGMAFYTRDALHSPYFQEAVRISGRNGCVGIGKTDPIYPLDVNGKIVTNSNIEATGQVTGLDGLVTKVVASAITDDDFDVDQNGKLAIDSSNHRLYFRYGGGWHYCAQDAGFQIPADETEGLSVGDIVIGKVNEELNDGALHARYIKLEDALKELGIYSEKEV